MRLSDLIASEAELRPLADTHYVLIRRESGAARRISVHSADLARALAERGGAADVELESRDVVTVFDVATSRDRFMQPLLEQLRRQSTADAPLPLATIDGTVNVPGRYPLEPGMRLRDLIRAGGGFAESAYVEQAELTRYTIVNGERREIEVRTLDLRRLAGGDREADVLLQPYDHLLIKQVPDWAEQETVRLTGEVRFPGAYPIRRGETLRSVIERAGGLTDLAFAGGSVFTREDLREREQAQLQKLSDRMEAELASLALQQSQSAQTAATTSEASSAGRALLAELRATQAVGRLVIDLPAVMRAVPGSAEDIVLKDGDTLLVPRRTQEVTVIGEVQNSTSHLYQAGVSRDQYVDLSGGTTQRADKKRIYVVRANGSVGVTGRSFLGRGNGAGIQPGDTIVVPLDAERMRPLPMWQAVTQIVYNLAIAAAAVNSF
jgi:protein involved in polysaccharide export with SLBB domain